MTMPKLSDAALAEIEDIALRVLNIESLENRKGRLHEYRDFAVWNVLRALHEAYLAGMVDRHRA